MSKTITPLVVTEKNAFGLTPIQQKQAEQLQAQCPDIVLAVQEVSQYEAGLKERYFGLCVAIRNAALKIENAAVRGMNRREVTLLLQSLGYSKQRITEINRVVEVPPELWAKFEAKQVGFRATLEQARGKNPVTAGEEGGEGQGGTPPTPTPPRVRITLTSPQMDHLAAAAKKLIKSGVKVTKGDAGYQFVYEGEGFKVSFNVFVDKLN